MPGVFKRNSDKGRAKAGKWTCWWIGEDGKQKTKVGFTDKAKSLDLATANDVRCRMIREGHIDPAEEARKLAAAKPIAVHVGEYRDVLVARGLTKGYVAHAIRDVKKIIEMAGIGWISAISPDRVQIAVAQIKEESSSSNANHALQAFRSFVGWLWNSDRIKDFPKGLKRLETYPVAMDRKRVRRAISVVDLARLLEAVESAPTRITHRDGSHGEPTGYLTGHERGILYRIAMATGFRANEIRHLTPERFQLDGDNPTITCLAKYSKRGKHSGKDDVQPISRAYAAIFREFLEGRPRDQPVLPVPVNTALMLRTDLALIGVPYRTADGRVLDFHALRGSFITHLVNSKAPIKVVQRLARHSTINLTMDVYASVEEEDIRSALEGGAATDKSGNSDT